jgi:hypothetical protein
MKVQLHKLQCLHKSCTNSQDMDDFKELVCLNTTKYITVMDMIHDWQKCPVILPFHVFVVECNL